MRFATGTASELYEAARAHLAAMEHVVGASVSPVAINRKPCGVWGATADLWTGVCGVVFGHTQQVLSPNGSIDTLIDGMS